MKVKYFLIHQRRDFLFLWKQYPVAVTDVIQQIEFKVKRLLQRNQRLEEENKELRNSVFEYLQQLDALKKQMNALEQERLMRKVSHLSEEEKKALLREIDKQVLLIDKCISSIKVSGML